MQIVSTEKPTWLYNIKDDLIRSNIRDKAKHFIMIEGSFHQEDMALTMCINLEIEVQKM